VAIPVQLANLLGLNSTGISRSGNSSFSMPSDSSSIEVALDEEISRLGAPGSHEGSVRGAPGETTPLLHIG
jgi:hypothetical protein